MSSSEMPSADDRAEALRRAIRQYQDFIRKNPNNAEAHHRLGVTHLVGGNLPEAIAALTRAVQLNGKDPFCLNNLGLAFYHAGDYVKARDCHAKALAIDPKNPDFHNNFGMALQKLNDLGGALRHFEAALAAMPEEPEILHNYGIALRDSVRMEAAASVLRKAIDLSGGMPDTYAALASVQFALGDAEDAAASCWSAVKMNPLHIESHRCFKGIMIALDRQAEKYATFRWACDAASEHPLVYENLGVELARDGDFKAAEPVLRRALTVYPSLPRALACLGWALGELKNHDESIACYEKAVALAPDNPEFLEGYGQSLIKAGAAPKAVTILKAAHESKPRRSSVLGMLTVALVEAGSAEVDRIVNYETDIVTRTIPVPEGFADLETFNEALHAELEPRHKAGVIPKEQTMRGGSQIPNFLFSNPSGTVLLLKNTIAGVIRDYVSGLKPDPDHPFLRYVNPDFRFTDAWSTILYGAGYDGSHTHSGGWISGVYYVKVPDLPDESWAGGEGCIQFGAPPDEFVSEKNRTRRLVRPQPGMLVLFPSYIWHGVRPFTQEGVRHSIAFDVI